jgi:AraC-like DNA-binding protein
MPRPGYVHRVWPDGCVSLVIVQPPGRPSFGVVVGARTTVLEVPTMVGDVRWGIRFRPEAGALCCGTPATGRRDTVHAASSVFPSTLPHVISALADVSDSLAAARVFDRWLPAIAPAERAPALATAAVDLIVASDGTCQIREIAATLRVSVRQLQRTFRLATGLTPKEYANVRRARAALKRLASDLPSPPVAGLSRVAAESGYADQAHLARECRRLLSLSPTALTSLLDDIAHHQLID